MNVSKAIILKGYFPKFGSREKVVSFGVVKGAVYTVYMYVCMVITYSRVWINRVRLPILLVVS